MTHDDNVLQKLYTSLKLKQIDDEITRQSYIWSQQARPEQLLPPGDWSIWLILAGRGFGKTRTGAEAIRDVVAKGHAKHIALIGATDADVRRVMLEGQSGLLSCYPDHERPTYESSKRLITWPNGAKAMLFSADAPEQLRGPQFDFVWIDELCKFDKANEVWDQVNFALRLGERPRALITTTPKPMPLLKTFLEATGSNIHITRGSTYDNKQNLSASFLKTVRDKYDGTTLGRQELLGELVERGDQGLWTSHLIQSARLPCHEVPVLRDIIIAVDPSVTHTQHSDETGIIVMGRCAQNLIYIIDDLSGSYAPNQWMRVVSKAFGEYKASLVLLESNQGGDVLKSLLQTIDPTVRVKNVRATRNKYIRAEPVHALYEQGRIKHAHSKSLSLLEDQMISFSLEMVQKKNISPDRVDALVWGVTDLAFTYKGKENHNVI